MRQRGVVRYEIIESETTLNITCMTSVFSIMSLSVLLSTVCVPHFDRGTVIRIPVLPESCRTYLNIRESQYKIRKYKEKK